MMTEIEEPKLEGADKASGKARDKGERRQRHRKDRDQPMFRVVVRRLPPSMTEVEFLEHVAPLPEHDNFYFAPADRSLRQMASPRAYMTFKNQEDIFHFRDRVDGYVFVDSKGAEWPAVVEFAPFQGFRTKGKEKPDPKEGTIENEPHYLAFLDKLKADAEAKPQEGKVEYTFKLPQPNEVTTTPLLEYLANKKAEKLAEKKRKIDEKKKRRDDERTQKKQQVLKSIPEPIKEEKAGEKVADKQTADIDDDGIMVRVVPSRLDRNQRQKVKDDKQREVKLEKERARNQQRKERRQERREKEKADRAERRKNETARSESVKSDVVPEVEVKPIEKQADTQTQGKALQKKKEVKKYSERRKEIRERAEQRRQAEEQEDMENVTGVEDKPAKSEATDETRKDSWIYKESSGSEDKGKNRIRNKDRPSIQIYQPRKVRIAANFEGSEHGEDRERKSSREEEKDEKKEEKKIRERKNSKEEKKPKKERKNSGDSRSGKESKSPKESSPTPTPTL